MPLVWELCRCNEKHSLSCLIENKSWKKRSHLSSSLTNVLRRILVLRISITSRWQSKIKCFFYLAVLAQVIYKLNFNVFFRGLASWRVLITWLILAKITYMVFGLEDLDLDCANPAIRSQQSNSLYRLTMHVWIYLWFSCQLETYLTLTKYSERKRLDGSIRASCRSHLSTTWALLSVESTSINSRINLH